MRINLKSLTEEELKSEFSRIGLPQYRCSQLLHWLYEKRAAGVDDISEFSKKLRTELDKLAYISNLQLRERHLSSDGTEKFLFGLEDNLSIESVLIPINGRYTLCISSQVGCAVGCKFCLTGTGGLKRNLKAHEIVDQIIAASRLIDEKKVSNIVLMGMGEPLHNLNEVIEALHRMTALMNISPRRITVSTSGVVDRMQEFANRAPTVNLAGSLNATTDRVRNRIMPINKRFPIEKLLEACRRYPLPPRRRITFEYVIIKDVNDSYEDAKRLGILLRGIPCKINIIPLNAFEGCELQRPSDDVVSGFQNVLAGMGYTAMLRKSRGQDIHAACGQLRVRYERNSYPETGTAVAKR